MSVQQCGYFCPVCQQRRLFTRQGMNHTPHILASVFLCGLWLPIWALTAATYKAWFHCNECGHCDDTRYLANPMLRQQEAQAQQLKAQTSTTGETSPPNVLQALIQGFSGISNFWKAVLISAVIVTVVPIVLVFGIIIRDIDRQQRLADSQNSNENNNSSATIIATATPSKPPPPSLSSSDHLALGKKALSDGDLDTARNHLFAIPKDAKEFGSARQYLATIEKREQRKTVQAELNEIESKIASQEDIMNRTEHMLDGEGTIGKMAYAAALKRKGELQLQRIKLKQKLKSMP